MPATENGQETEPSAGSTWRWLVADAANGEVQVTGLSGLHFANQSDAESWLGEVYADLASGGADHATLMVDDRVVYGPMSLNP